MPFWTYLLHCADRSFYVGHTDDLETRMGSMEQAVSLDTQKRACR
ncbi:hypothetical protein EBBID32_29850 [Sphingobium indicum BiD32]|uniref:GIY-YIG domain-containing protein n=1 Tax=Sphingobium indicum BiD32 TaxID=1301087 RepID=N1MNW5_9SPHN|nr:GIY-YIG nuclease family protein [Sphingobium indicum]CCW18631.1 hypothetical protein EBBID32_29850 [Sphingobium indicum BiD32]